jgi:7-keto-8-aminopelargonate synthetase-like enzyme
VADWLQGEAALTFANGYAANVGCLSAICDASYVAFIDRLAHASLVDGVRLSGAKKVYFRHNDMEHLAELAWRNTGQPRQSSLRNHYSAWTVISPLSKRCCA